MQHVRDYKLDTLKALAIALVLIWHLQPIKFYPIDNLSIPLSKKILGLVYRKTLIAVPIFYFVSLLLFFKKNVTSHNYIKNRLSRILSIFTFWSLTQTIIYYITKKLSFVFHIPFHASTSNSKMWWWLIMGGPSLPVVGDSVFYFLSNLLLLTALAFYYEKFSSAKIDIFVFILFSIYIMTHQFFFTIPYWRPDNFLIYIPIAHFVYQKYYPNIISFKSLKFSLTLFLLLSVIETVCHEFFNTRTGAYDLNSLQWGVISFFIFVQLFTFKRRRVITWLSKYSLGIFALHKYWFLLFLIIFNKEIETITISTDGAIIKIMFLLIFILTIFFTFVTIRYLSKNTALQRFIS